ncbi:MAG: hypothetical protein JWN73_2598 [Betaproteobacteria bacterium]|nr:hypothetical protein [Betaproteobacteria bacterium]
MLKIIPIALALFACGVAQAQVYKWVDSKGVTHYDQKPPEGARSKELQLHDGPQPGAAPPAGSGADWEERSRAFKERQAKREKDAAKQDADREKQEAQCKSMTGQLAQMRSARRFFNNDANGDRVYMDDQQREAMMAQREQEYNQKCN